MADTWAHVVQERHRLADLFEGLTPEQAATPSLCAGWTTRDVVAHLSLALTFSLVATPPSVLLASRGNPATVIDLMTARATRRTDAELLALFRERAGRRWTPPLLPAEAPLADLLVHGLDIRHPLGIEHRADPEALRLALGFVTSPRARLGFTGKGTQDGLRLEATDVDWSHGSGATVAGPALSLLSALCGRPAPAEALTGAGADELRRRLAG